jgi:GR25 family glycosyltransferase involved in LPS biosynthesis
MKGKAAWLGMAAMIVALGIALAGCATGPSSSPAATKSQADLLKEAGFRTHTAQGANVAYLYTLPAKKVVLNKTQDKPVYLVCTDPDSKQCFLGDEAAYQRYQQMAIQQSISEDMHKVSEQRSDPEALQMWVNSQGGG